MIDQFGLAFSPPLLIMSAGDTVEFRNSEASLSHNVALRPSTGGPVLVDEDSTPGEVLRVPVVDVGGYDVLCDMHPGMAAFLFASDAPWTVYAEIDGTFELGRIPAGSYVAQLWTADGGFHPEQRISVDGSETFIDVRPSG